MSDDPSDRDLLAAEYVLGVLTTEQARALEALAMHDDTIAASIDAWQARLAPLALAVAQAEPPPVLWRRLALATGIDSVIATRTGPPRFRFWRSAGLWRATTVAALALAASLGFMLLSRPGTNGTTLLAALSAANGPAPAYLVRVDPDGHAVVVPFAAPNLPPGKVLELWSLNVGATAPVSLGILPADGTRHLVIANHPQSQLLLSEEPPGGSPTGQPTGPVVFKGTLTGT